MGATDNNIRQRIQQSLMETERLMGRNQYNMAMVKARQTLEFMVNCLGEKFLLTGGDLAESIDQLFEGRFISQATRDHYHRIRILGNKAVHEGDNNPHDGNEAYQLLTLEAQAFANIFNNSGNPNRPPSRPRQAPVNTIPISSRSNPVRPLPPRTEGPRQGQGRNNVRPVQSRPQTSRSALPPERQAPPRSNVTKLDSVRNSERTSGRGGSRSSQHVSSQNRSRRRTKKKGFDPYDLIKPGVIFLVLLVIVIIIVKVIPKKEDPKQTPAPETSTETMATTPPPETSTAPPETQPAPAKVYTTTSKLNVRAEPATTGTLLGTLATGTVVEFVEKVDEEWTAIMFDGQQAYVASRYLTVSDSEAEAVSTEASISPSESSAAGT